MTYLVEPEWLQLATATSSNNILIICSHYVTCYDQWSHSKCSNICFWTKILLFWARGGELEVELWLNYFFANTDPGFLFSGTVISQLVRIKIFHSFEVCKV
jgi:hypothetical protein